MKKKVPRPKQKFPYRVSNVHFKHPVLGFKKVTQTRPYDEILVLSVNAEGAFWVLSFFPVKRVKNLNISKP